MERCSLGMIQSPTWLGCERVQGLRGRACCTWLPPPLGGGPPGHDEGLNTRAGAAGTFVFWGHLVILLDTCLAGGDLTTWTVRMTAHRGGQLWAWAQLCLPCPFPRECQKDATARSPHSQLHPPGLGLCGCWGAPLMVQGHKRESGDLKRKHSLTVLR